MYGIAIEQWDYQYKEEVLNDIESNFGLSDKKTWYIDEDYDLITLCMNNEIYIWFCMKWKV